MSLIDIEQEKIKEWTKNNQGCFWGKIDEKMQTYFENCKENMDVEELQFSNVQQLRNLLESKKIVIKDKEIDLICAVAVFKRKHSKSGTRQKVGNREDKTLPDYIYHF